MSISLHCAVVAAGQRLGLHCPVHAWHDSGEVQLCQSEQRLFVYCWSVCAGLKLLCEKQQEVAQCVLPRRLPAAGCKLGVDDWAPCAPVDRLKLHEAIVACQTRALVCFEPTHEQKEIVLLVDCTP